MTYIWFILLIILLIVDPYADSLYHWGDLIYF